ncbi:MAG TPA: acyl-CoA thioesterase [Smithellaceae bacterium]|nr:acyl-CoA thioesterase [Smithellaceae bacterium]HQM45387.1 acyl-CoA thioesterase [Smithellaceae bacterium]
MEIMKPKGVKDSSITIVQQMTQQDANLAGNVHGGVIMKLIDNTAGIVAARHCQSNVVTASIDQLNFHSPVFIGDLLRIIAAINHIGKTSMELGVRVEAENAFTGEVRHTASAYLTFVALDATLKPRPIPPVTFETEEEKRRNSEAAERRRTRLEQKGKGHKQNRKTG